MLIGIAIGIVIMAMLFLCVYIGTKLQFKPKVQIQTEQEIEALRKRDEGFSNIMDYDYNVAIGKRVNK